jgi:hypothetical protein
MRRKGELSTSMIAQIKGNTEWLYKFLRTNTVNYKKLSLNMIFKKIKIRSKATTIFEFQTTISVEMILIS